MTSGDLLGLISNYGFACREHENLRHQEYHSQADENDVAAAEKKRNDLWEKIKYELSPTVTVALEDIQCSRNNLAYSSEPPSATR